MRASPSYTAVFVFVYMGWGELWAVALCRWDWCMYIRDRTRPPDRLWSTSHHCKTYTYDNLNDRDIIWYTHRDPDRGGAGVEPGEDHQHPFQGPSDARFSLGVVDVSVGVGGAQHSDWMDPLIHERFPLEYGYDNRWVTSRA